MSSNKEDREYECVKKKIDNHEVLSEEIYSLMIYGSYERGDFIGGLSDLDFFVVVKEDENIVDELKDIISECFTDTDYRMIDVCWEYLENLNDPMNDGYPYKFLTVYQDDFLNNHTVIYGDEIKEKIPSYEFDELIDWRAGQLLDSSEEFENDSKMLKIISGEVARLIALIEGAGSLKKEEVIETLNRSSDEEARQIYRAYLEEEQDKFDGDFLIDFIRSRCREIKKNKESESEI